MKDKNSVKEMMTPLHIGRRKLMEDVQNTY